MSCPPTKKTPELRSETPVSRAELEVLRQKAADLSLQKPEKAAVILADWLKRAAGRISTAKKAG